MNHLFEIFQETENDQRILTLTKFPYNENSLIKNNNSKTSFECYNTRTLLPTVALKNDEQGKSKSFLLDNHHTFPRLILHDPTKGFYVHQFYNAPNKSETCGINYIKQFIAYPFGPYLVCVRFFIHFKKDELHFHFPPLQFFSFISTLKDSQIYTLGICKYLTDRDFVQPFYICKNENLTCEMFWIHSLFDLSTQVDNESSNNYFNQNRLLVVITKTGLLLLQIDANDNVTVKQEICDLVWKENLWFEDISSTLLFQMDHGILLPVTLNHDTLQYEKKKVIDLHISKWSYLSVIQVSLMHLYNSTYCITLDRANGIIRMLDVFSGKQELMALNFKSPGKLYLQRLDNLLVIHRPDRAESHLYDIQETFNEPDHDPLDFIITTRLDTEDFLNPEKEIKSTRKFPSGDLFDPAHYPDSWNFTALSGLIIHKEEGIIYNVKLNIKTLIQQIVKNKQRKLKHLIHFLLRRQYGKSVFLKLLISDFINTGGRFTFSSLANAYSNALESTLFTKPLSKSMPPNQQTFFFIEEIIQVVNRERLKNTRNLCYFFTLANTYNRLRHCYLSENEITFTLFQATLSKMLNLPEKADLFELRFTPLSENSMACSENHKFISLALDGLLRFCRCFLEKGIKIHESLGLLIIDFAVFCGNDNILQDLMLFESLDESPKIVERLLRLCSQRKEKWIAFFTIQMALKLSDWVSIAFVLLEFKQYDQVIALIRRHNLFKFPLYRLLETVSNDLQTQAVDFDVFQDIVLSVRQLLVVSANQYHANFAKSYNQNNIFPPKELIPCDVTACEKWFPELL